MPRQSGGGPGAANRGLFRSYHDEKRVNAMQFGLISPEEINQMSVAEIKNTQIYDQTTFMPNFNAVNDPRMGTMEKEIICVTCRSGMDGCPGHFGHIQLNSPVYHAAPRGSEQKAVDDREALMKIPTLKARFKKLHELSSKISMCDPETGGCGYKQPKFRRANGLKLEIEYQDENFDHTRDRKETLWPEQAHKVLAFISDEDCALMGLNPKYARPEWAIIKNLAVAPPPVRPSVQMGSGFRSEDDLTYSYQQILKINLQLKDQKDKGANQTIINELQQVLQYYVATLMDNSIAGQPVHKHKSGKALKSVRARLKGKEGRLRGSLMGKRTDFSSRTVITPDPSLAIDQIGVPHQVARHQTVPETVTPQNIEKLRQLVQNGPENWPGAKFIIRHDGRQIDLSVMVNRSDVHLEYGYQVERHLQDGDHVVINRQPSLHKMSLMGHRVKVLPYDTFRLNLSVCTPYNADFDGDEMNMHVPQSYETLAEIKELMAVPKQIIAPKSNSPIMGIVQDSLLGAMLMTQRDTFIEKDAAMLLAMWLPNEKQRTLPVPAIIKPQPLWTGKQIFSMLIPEMNLERQRNRKNKFCCPNDSNVLIEQGELLSGVLNKQIIGCTGGGLSHVITREHGHQGCADFLSAAQLLVNNWLLEKGFTVGVQDIIVHEKAISEGITNTLQKFKQQVSKIVQKSQLGQLKSQPGKSMQESFEAQVNKKLNDARDKSGNLALDGLSSHNRLRNMVQAGSKGSNINISQIMACVGQQNVEGGRIKFGFNRRTLPHFTKDDFGPESRGFVESCYLSGLSPSELYFHAMGGREGLIDTAVKTAETGYISRRLIKAMEDIMAQYDGTVRSSRGEIVQFLYGEDGMASESIEDIQIDLVRLSDAQLEDQVKFPVKRQGGEAQDRDLVNAVEPEILQYIEESDGMAPQLKAQYDSVKDDRDCLRYEVFRNHCEDTIHLPVNLTNLLWQARTQFGITAKSKSNLKPDSAISKLADLQSKLNVIPGTGKGQKHSENKLLIAADVNSRRLLNMYMTYKLCAKNVIMKERLSGPAFDWLLAEVESRFHQAIVQPGEMVGSIAAQSLGEPATQMTLNTFHFAGISAKNVTLGVPRFREIINVASNIKTPSLKVFLKPKYRKKESVVTKLGGLIEYTTLSHVVAESGIYYDPDPERTLIKADTALVQLYNEVPVLEDQAAQQKPSPWLLRLELDPDKMVHKDLTIAQIDKKLSETFGDQIIVQASDENCEKLVIRCRVNNIEDDEEETVPTYLKNEFEPLVLNQLQLKGFPEIAKVTFSKYTSEDYCSKTGKLILNDDNWLIETDGTALAKILTINKVDATRTVSNDCLEILKVFGVEASRQSLVNEFRFVLGSYGIYVNYRHLATLCDLMTHRGKLMSITRHGINRVASCGPLRKCSFEETVEILLEGAVFSERDSLKGITENVILGQLAPYGSGAFDLTVDLQSIEAHAHSIFGANGQLECYSDEGLTPDQKGGPGYMTPMIDGSPALAGATTAQLTPGSAYSNQQLTPGYDQTNFSPNPYQNFGGLPGSPNYQSPSPCYGASPQYGGVASPAYGATNAQGKPMMQSPIYAASTQSLAFAASSAHGQVQQSPNYGGVYSPTYNAQSPGYGQSSPSHVSSSLASASAGLKNATTHVSPSYSPSSGAKAETYSVVQSPSYGHSSSVNFGMKTYAGPSPTYGSPSNVGSSIIGPSGGSSVAAYSPSKSLNSPCYVPPGLSSSGDSAGALSATSMVKPMAYNPASPAYEAGGGTIKEEEPKNEDSDTD